MLSQTATQPWLGFTDSINLVARCTFALNEINRSVSPYLSRWEYKAVPKRHLSTSTEKFFLDLYKDNMHLNALFSEKVPTRCKVQGRPELRQDLQSCTLVLWCVEGHRKWWQLSQLLELAARTDPTGALTGSFIHLLFGTVGSFQNTRYFPSRSYRLD